MKNRAIEVRLKKVDQATGEETPVKGLDPEQINSMVTQQLQNVAITVGAVILVKKGADTLSELILIFGRKYI